MTFRDFIETEYDVRDQIDRMRRNPIKEFLESDIFPCDFVESDGTELVKMLYYDNGKRDIPVLDLLSYRREDLVKNNDKELLELYDNYVSNFKFDGLDLQDPVNISKFRDESLRRKGLIIE